MASDLCGPVLDLFYAFLAIVFQKKKKIKFYECNGIAIIVRTV